MRDFKGMKRQRGRNRGGGGQGGGGGKPQHNINRSFDSNGPENVKVRGAAQLVYEKYQALARDATLGGDRVLAENHLQHAEHYFRTLRAIQPNRAASDIVSRDSSTSGYDIDFEDESAETAMEQADAAAAARAGEPQAEAPVEGEAAAEGQPRFERDRGERREWRDRPERQDRQQGDARERQAQDRSDRPPPFQGDRQDRGEFRDRQNPNGGQNPNGQNGDRPRYRDAPRAEGGDRPRHRDRDDRFRDRAEGEVPQAVEPATVRDAPAAFLRSEDGGISQAPDFLQPPVALGAEEGDLRRPRRLRRPRHEDGNPAVEVEDV